MNLRLDEAVKVEEFLRAVYEMSLSEDWSESDAQELIMGGGQLYDEILNRNL